MKLSLFIICGLLFTLTQSFSLDYYYGSGIGFKMSESFKTFQDLTPEVKEYLAIELADAESLLQNRYKQLKDNKFILFSNKPLLESKQVVELEVLDFPIYKRPDQKKLQKALSNRLLSVTNKRGFDSLNDESSQVLYFEGFPALLIKAQLMKNMKEYVAYMCVVPCGNRSIFLTNISEKSKMQELEKEFQLIAKSFIGFAYTEEKFNSRIMLFQFIFLSAFFLFYKLK
ncbi:MAG: hypothetical protein KC646_12660 [Candidatus Cloacimonetes bacterium]|nr:hypothetical protein [Candidatus Cloacimonadota bacterium]